MCHLIIEWIFKVTIQVQIEFKPTSYQIDWFFKECKELDGVEPIQIGVYEREEFEFEWDCIIHTFLSMWYPPLFLWISLILSLMATIFFPTLQSVFAWEGLLNIVREYILRIIVIGYDSRIYEIDLIVNRFDYLFDGNQITYLFTTILL